MSYRVETCAGAIDSSAQGADEGNHAGPCRSGGEGDGGRGEIHNELTRILNSSDRELPREVWILGTSPSRRSSFNSAGGKRTFSSTSQPQRCARHIERAVTMGTACDLDHNIIIDRSRKAS